MNKSKDPKTVVISARVTEGEEQILKALGAATTRSMHTLIREALIQVYHMKAMKCNLEKLEGKNE
jgi:hypothetical protein